MWVEKLKIAVVQKDTNLLDTLLDSIPEHLSKEELDSAIVLIEQAKEMVQALQDETASSMLQIQKNKEFLESTASGKQSQLDITS